MQVMTILIDTREQKPYEFDDYPVDTRRETLRTADYTVPELCEYNEEYDTYFPFFGVERKSGHDLLSSITKRRENFKDEIKRASEWDEELEVVIEEPKQKFMENKDFMQYRNVTPSQVSGTIDTWEKYYNVSFLFMGTREKAEQRTFDSLLTWRRLYGD